MGLREEWQAALKELEPPTDQAASTVEELAELWGMGRGAATRRADMLVSQGLAKQTFKRLPSGHRSRAYILLKKGK